MKHYDLHEIKARLPDYLHAIGTEIHRKGESHLAAACPIHRGTKRNFHADLMPDGTWLWTCRSGCGGQGGTTLDLHAKLHGQTAGTAACISGTAGVLNVLPSDGAPTPRNAARNATRRHQEARQQAIAEERQRTLTTNLTARRMELLAPYLSNDWRADFYHDSPLHLEPSHDGQTRQMIEWLFSPADLLWMGGVEDSGRPEHRANFRTPADWLNVPNLPPRISPGTYREGSNSRGRDNLLTEPFLIIESDELIGHKPTTEADREANRQLNAALMLFLSDRFRLELRALIDTGGKSLHGWFTHPGQDTTCALSRLLDGLAIDSSVFHRASCAPLRAPGCLHEGTGNRASLYYLNPPF